MSHGSQDQIQEWLNKLERESWQLELLVSAFTIFLLIGANSAYEQYLMELSYTYDMTSPAVSIVSIFMLIIKNSILALTISLIIHLMLRGFWIGTIGLRSVQPNVDFDKLKFNPFFTEKLKKKGVISLDTMVVQLDEICSVIFAFSFLIISILVAFAMYLITLGLIGLIFSGLVNLSSGVFTPIVLVISSIIAVVYLLMGIVYMLDYLTLGFFKKINWFAKIYYPFYWLFNLITFSRLSKSIYYYLISKFSKNIIRTMFVVLGLMGLSLTLFDYDQHSFFPDEETPYMMYAHTYDDVRAADDYIVTASIPSQFIEHSFLPVFLRYDPSDNSLISSHCPDFQPLKDDGLNFVLQIQSTEEGFNISSKDYSTEDYQMLLSCHSSMYEISVNDSIVQDLTYRFYTHPAQDQKGLLTILPSDFFRLGENTLHIQKRLIDTVGHVELKPYVSIPFWYHGE